MHYKTIKSEFFCGVDVHSKKSYLCILDNTGEKHVQMNIQNSFQLFKDILTPYIPNIVVGCESTYTYYWLADGCRQANIPFYLGHALYMKAISKNKHKHDPLDARTIADLLRTSFFPEAYPYPREMRPTRDLLRRRQRYVAIRAEAFTHIQMVAHQNAIHSIGSYEVKKRDEQARLIRLFTEHGLETLIHPDIETINAFDPIIARIEQEIRENAIAHNPRDMMLLKTAPGIGDILALIILYETHDIRRFPKHQNYASYSRVVRCPQTSSGKITGIKNQNIGNPYLKYAFNAIIISAQQQSAQISKYYKKLESKFGKKKARARMAHKFNTAVYYMLKNRIPFDEKMFLK